MTAKKEEESFPRGRLAGSSPALRSPKVKLFKTPTPKKPKKSFKRAFIEDNPFQAKFKKSKSNKSKVIDELKPSHTITPLTYWTLEEGMVVVGRVKEIHPYHLFICLPGKLSAKVPITAISGPYSNSLTSLQKLEITQKECPSLRDLFNVGQALVCSIVEVKKEDNLLAVSASLDPALVNKERSHNVVRAGHTLVAAVHTIEDHGYTLHTGIGGLTTFLKFRDAAKYIELKNHGRSLVVGELVRCIVTKCTTSRSASRAEVTLDPRIVAETTITDGNTQTLHPGTAVSCVVQQSTSAGLVVSIGRYTAYVEAAQLPSCWSLVKDIQPEEELKATVIYSLPNTDFQITARPMYLTLKNLNQLPDPKIATGDIVEARVIQRGPKGLILCLGDKKDKGLGNKGIVSIRRLGENIPKDKVVFRFPKGTVVMTKVLGFDYMEEVYNCSLEKHMLEQHYISYEQVKVGDRVSCKVLGVEAGGLILGCGRVNMYAFREQSADEPYEDLHQHFRIGDIVDARILRKKEAARQVFVTLKETLIRSPALMSYEEANQGEGYWGTVRVNKKGSRYPRKIVISFYNDVVGNIYLEKTLPSDYKLGQLVMCYVKNVKAAEKKMTLSFDKPKKKIQKNHLTIGEKYQLVITDVGNDLLKVSCCDFEGVEGFIPKIHLTDSDNFREGDFILAWLYHTSKDTKFFSHNQFMGYFFKNPTNVLGVRRILTCCVCAVKKTKVSVLTGLPDIPIVDVPKEEWPANEQPNVHQLVRLFVHEYEPENKTLILKCTRPPKQATVNHNTVNNQTKENSPGKSEKSFSLTNNVNIVNSSEGSDGKRMAKKKTQDKTVQSNSIIEEHEIKIEQDELVVTSNKKRKRSESSSEEVRTADPNTNSNVKQSKKVKSMNTTNDETKEKGINKKIKKAGKSALEKTTLDGSENESEDACDDIDLNTSDFDSDDSSSAVELKKKRENSKCQQEDSKVDKTLTKPNNSKIETEEEPGIDKKAKKIAKSLSEHFIKPTPKPKLTLKESGFNWDIKPEDLVKPSEAPVDDVDEDDEDLGQEKKKKKTDRRQEAKAEEARLRLVEQTLLDSGNNPQSADQFDRVVLARPDDDELWIKYMSHHLQATEIEKARAVARRALKTISQRMDVERLNVWIALLNLENLYGTQETLKSVLEEALRANDEFSVYTRMLNIFCDTNKAQEAEQLVHTVLRKFRESLQCWVTCCSTLMRCGLADKARNLLQRAISALPAKQHVTLLCKFALLENQHGNGEQAQSLFEHILTTYPKRTDIWKVYVDMLVKSKKVNVAREILGRAAKQKLPPRKMKMLFNKWISFEEKHGTPEKVENVRKQALAYVNNITNKLDEDE